MSHYTIVMFICTVLLCVGFYIHQVLGLVILVGYTIWSMYLLDKQIEHNVQRTQTGKLDEFVNSSRKSESLVESEEIYDYQDNTWDQRNLAVKMTNIPGSTCDIQGVDDDLYGNDLF